MSRPGLITPGNRIIQRFKTNTGHLGALEGRTRNLGVTTAPADTLTIVGTVGIGVGKMDLKGKPGPVKKGAAKVMGVESQGEHVAGARDTLQGMRFSSQGIIRSEEPRTISRARVPRTLD